MSSNQKFRGRGPTRGRGRGRFSSRGGRFASHSYIRTQQREPSCNKKWIRSSDDTSAAAEPETVGESTDGGGEGDLKGIPTNESEGCCDPIDSGDTETNNASKLEKADVTATNSNDFKRRGKHKLVLKKENKNNIEDTSSVQQDISSSGGIGVPMVNSSNYHQDDTEKVTSASLEKRGKNKLVLKREDDIAGNSRKLEPIASSDEVQARTKASFTWSRHLVSQTNQRNILDETPADRYIADNRKRMRQNTQHYNTSAKGSRRICLNNTQANESSSDVPNDEAKLESESSNNTSTDKSTITGKHLTDFAYRNIGRGRGRKCPRTANMGLVRVKPEDPSATAICPTFRRGLPCNNPKCTLRHDVSSEASRPICVFFQRNGMCSKGDECIFRHVKVRWDAEVCPMFEKVGYCEDPDCVLRHVVSKKLKDGTGDSKS